MKNKFNGIVKRVAPVCLGFVALAESLVGCVSTTPIHQLKQYDDMKLVGSGLIGRVPTYVFKNESTGDYVAAYVCHLFTARSSARVYICGVAKSGAVKWRANYQERALGLSEDISNLRVTVFEGVDPPPSAQMRLETKAAGREALGYAVKPMFPGRKITRDFLRSMKLTQLEKKGGVSMETLLLWAKETMPLEARRPDGVFAMEKAGRNGAFVALKKG